MAGDSTTLDPLPDKPDKPDAHEEHDECAELYCVNCGYNLHGLARDSACPECGCPARVSRREDHPAEAGPAYLARLRRGAIALTVCVAVSPLLNVNAVFGAIAALWLLTTPQPGRDEPAEDWRRRVAARLGLAGWVLFMSPLLAGLVVAWREGRSVHARWWMYDGLFLGALIVLALGLVAAWAYLAILAERLAAPALAGGMRRLARGWVIGLGVVAAGGLAASLTQGFVLPAIYGAGGWWSPMTTLAWAGSVALVLIWLWVRTWRACRHLQRVLSGAISPDPRP